jgi:hypothetical protein
VSEDAVVGCDALRGEVVVLGVRAEENYAPAAFFDREPMSPPQKTKISGFSLTLVDWGLAFLLIFFLPNGTDLRKHEKANHSPSLPIEVSTSSSLHNARTLFCVQL